MAKNFSKKSTFGGSGVFDGIEPPTTSPTPTHTHAHTHTHTHIQPVKELKTRRVQLLLKESTVNSLDKYVKNRNTSRNDLIQTLVDEFLSKNG